MPDISQLIDLSPPVGLLFALNLFLYLVRKGIPNVPTWIFPWLAFVLGGAIYPLISDPGKVPYQMRSPLMAQVIVGLIIGGCSVGSHQLFQKTMQRLGLFTEDTSVPINS